MHLNEVSKCLGSLIRTDQIRTERKNNTVYYVAKNMEEKPISLYEYKYKQYLINPSGHIQNTGPNLLLEDKMEWVS